MAATSKTSPVKSGKETIYTATKVIGPNGDGDYTTEIIKYDSGKGDNPRTIATTDKDGKTQWTSNASDEDKKAASEIRKASRSQVKSIADDVTENAEQKEALNKASNNTNEALAAEANAEFYNRAKADVAQAIKNTREEGFSFHIFPETMRVSGNSQDFLKIDMMKYEPNEVKVQDLGFDDREMNRKSIGTVILPIPGGIKDQQQVSWADDKMSAAQIALSDIALNTITEGGKGFVDSTGRVIDAAGANISDIKKALSANIAGAAAGANRLLTRQTGAIMNPNMELLFDSPQLRDFTFSFLLSPRSEKESKTIVKIIRFFKQGMSPIRSKSRLFLRSPHTFRLAYKYRERTPSLRAEKNNPATDHKFLNKFKECAMNGFGVDYTPNGQYSTYEDGSMTSYQVTMNFQEIVPIYNDDYGNGDEFTTSTPEIGF
tara:strand:- start:730 stop:2025 length:1296 start_codon:yes stop_codon:yes gene_type:complete